MGAEKWGKILEETSGDKIRRANNGGRKKEGKKYWGRQAREKILGQASGDKIPRGQTYV